MSQAFVAAGIVTPRRASDLTWDSPAAKADSSSQP
jgi:hypothetical protein